jgi:hypothetical protein
MNIISMDLRNKFGLEWKRGCVYLISVGDYNVGGYCLWVDNVVLDFQYYWLISVEKHF